MDWTDVSQKKYKWPIMHERTSNIHGYAKSRLHWDSVSPASEWLSSRKQTTNVGKDVEKTEPLYTVSETVNESMKII
jgi:hypothetical protein